jgi:predicted DNA binding CopG/RHH family protein
MRTQVTIYLPDELTERFKHQAERQGLSLSAYLSRQLATSTDQIAQLQFWIGSRLDNL